MFPSAVGSKLLMAATGLAILLFVLGHLAGNLQFFGGPDVINTYALHLRDLGPLLWVARLGLLAAFALHLSLAVSLTRRNSLARPEGYAFQTDFPQSSVASRHMWLTGWLILAFVVFHLAHFTFQWTHPEYRELHWKASDGREGHDVYSMIIKGFSQPFLVGLYIVAQVFLWLHLSHAVSSMLQTLGLKNPRNEKLLDLAGPVLATIIFVGYVSIPLAVLLGVVKPIVISSG
ncbi:succinate dehydrogenase cytochrome b subunit [bacterium]|jgi:succinate dehydrogenase / fumarate reductase, cytochrome b subunit|nr:succinate dehydrogenase cytochrome b subunit [bacterium]